MNTTIDQPFTLDLGTGTRWMAGDTTTAGTSLAMLVTNVVGNSGTASTASGALYRGAGKTNGITVNTALSSLTSNTATQRVGPGAVVNSFTETTVYFSLTTPQGAACTADVYLFGIPLP